MLLFYSSEIAGKLLLTKDMLLLSLCFAYTGELISCTLELYFYSYIYDIVCINIGEFIKLGSHIFFFFLRW